MKIIECPRDAMQGMATFVPTEEKIRYINALLRVGFDTIDFGSFVSPKAIPQMSDTAQVLEGLDLSRSRSKLLAIVANVRGAQQAADYDEISYLGYPLSLSETFQERNTNRSIDDAFDDLAEMQEICEDTDKTLVVYLSMGFGNPYGDPYASSYVVDFTGRLDSLEISIVSLADTIGVATVPAIQDLFQALVPQFPHIEFGAHLHATLDTAREKVAAVLGAGVRRMDGAIRGFGGCPMATDELTGNIPTELILSTMEDLGYVHGLNLSAFEEALKISGRLFQ